MVAPSFQNLQQICEPYSDNGKMYVKVLGKNGKERVVRWYSDKEYAKIYGGTTSISQTSKIPVQFTNPGVKKALGFSQGYIYVIAGDTSIYEDWFNMSEARYARPFGWYIVPDSGLTLSELPAGTEAKVLTWEMITDANGKLYIESKIKEIVDELILPPASGKHIGAIGERISFDVICTTVKALPTDKWGTKSFHVFKDINENILTWTTGSKTLKEGQSYLLTGTVKEHNRYGNQLQTVLTRCNVKEK